MSAEVDDLIIEFRRKLEKKVESVDADIKANEGKIAVVNSFKTVKLTLAILIEVLTELQTGQ